MATPVVLELFWSALPREKCPGVGQRWSWGSATPPSSDFSTLMKPAGQGSGHGNACTTTRTRTGGVDKYTPAYTLCRHTGRQRGYSETDLIIVNNFLNALAEIALAVAIRNAKRSDEQGLKRKER